jgi:hypothetical protein
MAFLPLNLLVDDWLYSEVVCMIRTSEKSIPAVSSGNNGLVGQEEVVTTG